MSDPRTTTLLAELRADDDVSPIDTEIARWLSVRDEARGHVLALTGALLSREHGRGHSGITLSRWAGRPLLEQELDSSLPDQERWLETLRQSPLVGAPGERRPVVLDGERIYLFRYWQAERRVADAIRNRVIRRNPVDPQAPDLRALFGALSSDAVRDEDEIDWQVIAAVKALRHPLCLIAGGPGTGKTTTVTRILALLLAADPGLRVGLAAPTGKAAQRLGESIAAGREKLGVADEIRQRIPADAKTLHRLLGYSQTTGRFRHGPERPLPVDLLVIDEASMIDLLLFDAVLNALPSDARLILLGDPDQLASVETGFVFGDLCAAGNADGLSPEFVEFASTLGIQGLSPGPGAVTPLAECVVRLQKVHRFAAGSGIAALSAAIREGRAEEAAAIPDDPRYAEVEAVRGAAIDPHVHDVVAAHAAEMCAARTPEEALEHLTAVQVLSPTRHGARGTRQLNARIEVYLLEQGLRAKDEYFQGRPILVTTNDYDVGLFNGDLGVCWKLDGRDHVCFRDDRGGVRAVPVSQLPPHESAWAMTVHKSQGSEFEHVVLVLPDAPSELMTRELVYTAVTRARKRVTVLGEPEIIAHAVRRPQRRESGLRARLA